MKQSIKFNADGTATLVISATSLLTRSDVRWHNEMYSLLPCPKYHDEDDVKTAIDKFFVGQMGTLVTSKNVSCRAVQHGENLTAYFIDGGVAGNSDRSILRTTGWRGTTNDRSVDAHGIRTVLTIKKHKNRLAATIVFSKQQEE